MEEAEPPKRAKAWHHDTPVLRMAVGYASGIMGCTAVMAKFSAKPNSSISPMHSTKLLGATNSEQMTMATMQNSHEKPSVLLRPTLSDTKPTEMLERMAPTLLSVCNVTASDAE